MSKRKRIDLEEYRYGPRRVLRPGDRFRVKGGPIYITDDGREFPMYERGVFIFCRYRQQGAQKWIEAYRVDSGATAILWVGRSMRSPQISNIRRRPYLITAKLRPSRGEVKDKRQTRTAVTRKSI